MSDRGRKQNPGGGDRQKRFSRPEITASCSTSGSELKGVPGSHRSRSIAPLSASASSSRTVGSPDKNRKAAISSSASKCGSESLSTASDPSDCSTSATQEHVASPSSEPRNERVQRS